MSHDPRGDDELLIFGKRRAPLTEMDGLLEETFDSFRRSNPLLGPILRETEWAHRLVFELLTMKAPQRHKAVRNPPYRDLLVAEFMLQESAKVAPQWPERSEERAMLAEAIAAQPWPEKRERSLRIRAKAWMYQGDARRLLHDWRRAELGFGAAFSMLKELPIDNDHVLFCKRLARLREDQGRLREAAHLLWQGMSLYSQHSNSVPPNDLVVHLAYVYLKLNDPGQAMILLTQVSLRTADPFAGWNQAETDLGRAMCLAMVGLAEPARHLLEESKPDRRCIFDRDKVLRLEWIECKIAVHLGDLKEAIPRLEAIRRWLLRDQYSDQDLAEVCLCSIDLAFALAKRGQAEQRLPELLADLAKLPGTSEHPWALGSLWWFQEAVEQRRDLAAAAREAAGIVYRRERSLSRFVEEAKG
jgi:tetratricopeptide (TPR) repeat protein